MFRIVPTHAALGGYPEGERRLVVGPASQRSQRVGSCLDRAVSTLLPRFPELWAATGLDWGRSARPGQARTQTASKSSCHCATMPQYFQSHFFVGTDLSL